MPKNINKKKIIAPVVIAVAALAVLIPFLLVLVLPGFGMEWAPGMVQAFVIAYALVILLVIGGIIAALVSRIREIQKGEEDDAKKY